MSLLASNLGVDLGSRAILRDVAIELRPGEVLAIVGPNGAGKTTLLRALAGELRPTIGAVSLDGHPLATWSPQELARRRAVLPQKPVLSAAFTIEEVVHLGRFPHGGAEIEDTAAVQRALSSVGLADRAGDPYTNLSGGEEQRVMVARVLAQLDANHDRPRYLLLDEPTAALDLAWQHRLLSLARQLAQLGVAVFAILHDLTLAATYADRVGLLVDGRLTALGASREVLTAAAIERAYGVEATVIELERYDLRLPLVTGIRPPPASPPSPLRRPSRHRSRDP